MKRIFLLAIVLLMLGSVGLYAQYVYNLELDIISYTSGSVTVEVKHYAGSWQQVGLPIGFEESIVIEVETPAYQYPLRGIRVSGTNGYVGYSQAVDWPSHNSVLYFLIDLRPPFQDPTPPFEP
jgi:hypothetical protein